MPPHEPKVERGVGGGVGALTGILKLSFISSTKPRCKFLCYHFVVVCAPRLGSNTIVQIVALTSELVCDVLLHL